MRRRSSECWPICPPPAAGPRRRRGIHTLTVSDTTGARVPRIFLDAETSTMQQRTPYRIWDSFVGLISEKQILTCSAPARACVPSCGLGGIRRTNSGEISTSYRLLICSEISRWLIPQAYSPKIFSSIPSVFRLYLPMICGSYSPFRSLGNLYFHRPQLRFYCLFRVPVAIIPRLVFDSRFRRALTFFVPQLGMQFAFHHLLQYVPEYLLHRVHDLCGAAELLLST